MILQLFLTLGAVHVFLKLEAHVVPLFIPKKLQAFHESLMLGFSPSGCLFVLDFCFLLWILFSLPLPHRFLLNFTIQLGQTLLQLLHPFLYLL